MSGIKVHEDRRTHFCSDIGSSGVGLCLDDSVHVQEKNGVKKENVSCLTREFCSHKCPSF